MAALSLSFSIDRLPNRLEFSVEEVCRVVPWRCARASPRADDSDRLVDLVGVDGATQLNCLPRFGGRWVRLCCVDIEGCACSPVEASRVGG